jgi:hypothetical protein
MLAVLSPVVASTSCHQIPSISARGSKPAHEAALFAVPAGSALELLLDGLVEALQVCRW